MKKKAVIPFCALAAILQFSTCNIESSYIDLIQQEIDSNNLSNAVTNRFVTVGDSGTIYYSDDSGENWTEAENIPPGTPDLNRVLYVGDRLIAVGDGGVLWYSTDGSTWTAVITGTTYDLMAIAYGATVYVVVGENSTDGVTLTSTDGITWNGPFYETGGDSFRFNGITFGGSTFFATCLGTWDTRNGAAVNVLNGNWSNGTYEVTGGRGRQVEYGIGKFVLLFTNNGTICYGRNSLTGTTASWSTYGAGYEIGGSIVPWAFRNNRNGRLAAVGDNSTVWYTDDDGSTWTYLSNTAEWGNNARDIAYGTDCWVTVGLAGGVWISAASDLSTWTAASNPPGFQHLRGVAYIP